MTVTINKFHLFTATAILVAFLIGAFFPWESMPWNQYHGKKHHNTYNTSTSRP